MSQHYHRFRINFLVHWLLRAVLTFLPMTAFSYDLDMTHWWVHDRLLRIAGNGFAESYQKSEVESVTILSRNTDLALGLIEDYQRLQTGQSSHFGPIIEKKVDSIEAFEVLRERYLKSEPTLARDIRLLQERDYPYQLFIKTDSPEVMAHIEKIKAAYLNVADKKIDLRNLGGNKQNDASEQSFFGGLYRGMVQTAKSAYLFVNDLPSEIHLIHFLLSNDRRVDNLVNQIRQLSPDQKQKMFKDLDSKFRDEITKSNERILQFLNRIEFKNESYKKIITQILMVPIFEVRMDKKIQAALSVLAKPEDLEIKSVFGRILQSFGPAWRKFFQRRDENMPAVLADMFVSFENQNTLASRQTLDRAVAQFEAESGFKVVWIKESGAAGAMGEGHFAKIRKPDGTEIDAFFKFLHEGVEDGLKEDERILRLLQQQLFENPVVREKFPTLPKIIDDVLELIKLELDNERTGENQRKSINPYQGTMKIKSDGDDYVVHVVVPEVFYSKGRFSVTQALYGDSFDEIKNNHPAELNAALRGFMTKWAHRIFFGDGDFHQDIHPGNFIFKVLGEREIQVGVIDFGMTGKITQSQAFAFTMLSLANYLEDSKMIARYVYKLSLNGSPSADELSVLSEALIHGRAKALAAGKPFKMTEIFNVALGLRMDFDRQIPGLAFAYQKMQGNRKALGDRLRVDEIIKDIFENEGIPPSQLSTYLSEISLEDVTTLISQSSRLPKSMSERLLALLAQGSNSEVVRSASLRALSMMGATPEYVRTLLGGTISGVGDIAQKMHDLLKQHGGATGLTVQAQDAAKIGLAGFKSVTDKGLNLGKSWLDKVKRTK